MFSTRLAAASAVGGAALAICAGTVTVNAAPAAPHTMTMTTHTHGEFTQPSVNPCTGDPILVNFTGNTVFHITGFAPPSDEVWITSTSEGSITTVDGTVTYTGHATGWGNFNLNQNNGVSDMTLTIHAVGSDGSLIDAHFVSHSALDSAGNVVSSWVKATTLNCG